MKLVVLRNGVLALLATASLACRSAWAQDAEAGKAVFKAQCSICHSAERSRNLTGPSLFGIIGSRSGQMESFNYTDATRNAGVVWTPETLDLYLTEPKGVVPHNTMVYGGLRDASKRANLIAYLGTLR